MSLKSLPMNMYACLSIHVQRGTVSIVDTKTKFLGSCFVIFNYKIVHYMLNPGIRVNGWLSPHSPNSIQLQYQQLNTGRIICMSGNPTPISLVGVSKPV